MRIVIDMQGAQTESRFRGIGRYTISISKAIARNRGEHEVLLALSGLFPDTIEPIRAAFDNLLPQENIRVWYAPGPVRECEPGNEKRREAAELIREAFLASLLPDVIHLSSLFEGYVDDAVTSIGRFDKTTPVSISLYDLIPLLNSDRYLKPNPCYERYYLRKLEHLKKGSVYLAISEFSRKEVLECLTTQGNRVVNVSSAVEACFRPLNINCDIAGGLREKFGLTRPFVLHTGGCDERKNLPRLIQAFASLPQPLRSSHQLLLVGKIPQGELSHLQRLAKTAGLKPEELRFTGYVTDEELVQLYNLCELYVFPSWHEGFGLPALEAMACGCAVIASNTSSLPEIMGRDDTLFDPFNEDDITAKLAHALTDDAFRGDLEKHGLEQVNRFSWDSTAQKAWSAFETWHEKNNLKPSTFSLPSHRPKFAYVSPLPPERSGISDYSAELLPELSRHYEIDVVVSQESVCDSWTKANCSILDVETFRACADRYDRVLYHFGNSPFHQHMFGLLEEIPGVVVMHDFFLSSIVAHMDINKMDPGCWVKELYHSHGYSAVRDRFHLTDMADVISKYPCSLRVLQEALGIIVHSEHSRQLIRQWYGERGADHCSVIPLLRRPAMKRDRPQARRPLGLADDQFVVCSFGFLDPTKLNHRLLSAWLESKLVKDENSVLVFVGEKHGGEYGAMLENAIQKSGVKHRIRITGWVDSSTFQNYLMAGDVAVQLRAMSKGETSAAVLDCMNYGLPTIVNAHGSMADLPEDAVWKLPDEFEDSGLITALETLWCEPERHRTLGKRAREIILDHHAPAECARLYTEGIEHFYSCPATKVPTLVSAISEQLPLDVGATDLIQLAEKISDTLSSPGSEKRLFVDVSATCRNDLKTGIERVTKSILKQLLDKPPEGYRIEPVYLSDAGGEWHYRYARRYTLGFLDCQPNILHDERVESGSGDVLIGLDLGGGLVVEANKAGLFLNFRNRGVSVYFVVHDLLPITNPHLFPPGESENFSAWLRVVSQSDGAICVSKSTEDALRAWIKKLNIKHSYKFTIIWSHNGGDIEASSPTRGLPENSSNVLSKLKSVPSFLMVATIEPRKGHAQALAAFERLWAEDNDMNLVIVGKEGWKDLPDNMRRDIPEMVERLRNHPELNKRLIWLEGISDEYLEKVYTACTCLIAASEGEGFGLPLIEAAQHQLPIIARDIPVFQEVAGGHAFYFSGKEPEVLATAILDWMSLYKKGGHPKSDGMPWLTWEQSAKKILKSIGISDADG